VKDRHGRRIAAGLCVLACALGFGIAPTAAAGAADRPTAVVFPQPGSQTASLTTSISVRGVAPSAVGTFAVTGSRSGAHTGNWTAHPDNDGASFHPAAPFTAGETVTVHTSLAVAPTGADTYTFTVEQPSSITRAPDVEDEGLAPSKGASASANAPTTATYASRPDLKPPIMTVSGSGPVEDGLIAVTPRGTTDTQSGPLLLDDAGAPVYFKPVTGDADYATTDAEVQPYNGSSVLTWWQGENLGGHGDGQFEMLDTHYNHVATVKMDDGFPTDLHDMQITPQNTAIVMSYNPVSRNLTSFGGPANGTVLDLVVQEVNISTGDKLLEWHSLDDIPLSKSNQAAPTDASTAWDYIHGNAVDIDTDGNILVSGRHTSGVYKINRTTGALMWSLGKDLDFSSNFSDWFAFQHDVRRRSDGKLSVFDNSNGQGRSSRGLVMNLDETNHTVTIDHAVTPPSSVTASSQGAFRELGNGHDFIGWGNVGRFSEFNSSHNLVRDMTFPTGVQSYRATKYVWHATPTAPPDAIVDRVNTSVNVKVSWNGATDVTKWVVLAGVDANHLSSITARGRTGFETSLTASTSQPVIAIEARDKDDNPLGRSNPVGLGGTVDHTSYWMARSNGAVTRYGTAATMAGPAVPAGKQIVGMATVPNGYLLAAADGGVYAYGAARNLGSAAGLRLRAPIIGIAARYDGLGYWLVGTDGGVYAFGNAHFYGSMGGKHLNAAITGIAALPDGRGYWLVAHDGGIFSFGRAGFHGSTGSLKLKQPIVGMTAKSPDGKGYWLVARDGGIFAFGSAPFKGSTGALRLRSPITGMASTNEGTGYWLVAADGGVFTFGNAPFHGALPAGTVPFVAIAHN
jgi:hypothetical protein